MRTGFVTCVQLGADVLREIYDVGGRVNAIVTLHDDIAPHKSGRSFVDNLACQHQAALHKTHHVNDPGTVQWLEEQALDWLFVIGWSQIVNESVLRAPRYGALGMHPTLLPEGRGRASIPWAIIKRLEKTGVSLFKLDAGVDTGPVADQVEVDLHADETASSLYVRMMRAHRELIRRAWPRLADGTMQFSEQDAAAATVWPGRRPDDGLITPDMSVIEAHRLVRALTAPYPRARWSDRSGRVWKIDWGIAGSRPPGLSIRLSDGVYTATAFEQIA